MIKNKLVILILFFSSSVYCQDLFDLEHSKQYADYLYKSGEYSLAVTECRRILDSEPTDDSIGLYLVKSYRRLKKYPEAISVIKQFYPDSNTVPVNYAIEYGNNLILNKTYQASEIYLQHNGNIDLHKKNLYLAFTQLYEQKWQEADQYLQKSNPNHPSYENLKQIICDANKIKYKNPWLSVGMSLIIPGSGKIYSGYWKDGLMAFLFTGLSAWQAYRGFSKNGYKSVYGYINATLALGFYLGNIYGSGKAANKYNYEQNRKIKDKVDRAFYSFID